MREMDWKKYDEDAQTVKLSTFVFYFEEKMQKLALDYMDADKVFTEKFVELTATERQVIRERLKSISDEYKRCYETLDTVANYLEEQGYLF